MTTYCWTKLAALILVSGVVLATGNALNRVERQELVEGTPNSEGEKPLTGQSNPSVDSDTEHGDSSKDSDAAANGKGATPAATADDAKTKCGNGTSTNNTECGVSAGGIFNSLTENKAMLTRTLYVLIGVTAIIIGYFVVRAVRIRRRENRTKRYGVISTNDDRMEMTPLDQDDDDDEDLTVFEANGRLIK